VRRLEVWMQSRVPESVTITWPFTGTMVQAMTDVEIVTLACQMPYRFIRSLYEFPCM
jgi:hypothetical protein